MANDEIILPDSKRFFVLVSFDTTAMKLQYDRKSQQKAVHPGSFFWINAGESFAVKNTGSAIARFVLVEIP